MRQPLALDAKWLRAWKEPNPNEREEQGGHVAVLYGPCGHRNEVRAALLAGAKKARHAGARSGPEGGSLSASARCADGIGAGAGACVWRAVALRGAWGLDLKF